MSDFLINHAIAHVWCDPEQDFQHIFQPTRISDPRGVMGSTNLLWSSITLPTPTDRYHVYQLGQVYPASLGLVATPGAWVSLDRVCQEKYVFAQVYTADGLLFPLTESYLMQAKDKTLVLAVKEQPQIAPLKTTPLYFRFYSNAYFGSLRSASAPKAIKVGFYRFTNVNDAVSFQNAYIVQKAKPGFTAAFYNGQYVDGFLPMSMKLGDTVEWIYDSSVKRVVDFPIRELSTFDSILDAKRKYLLHYEGAQTDEPIIDYRDDCDVYLYKPQSDINNVFVGAYFHKNQNDAFRQVTHRDYSVGVPYVDAYLTSRPSWGDVNGLTIRLVVRHSGFERPLVYEAHAIHELYKLPEPALSNAFLGVDSNVDVWKAANLESSAYITIMDAKLTRNVTEPLVDTAYGYDAISRLIGDSPLLVPAPGAGYLDLPPALQTQSSIFEYDSQGHLIGWYPHALGNQYTPVYPGTALIEGVVGYAGTLTDSYFNTQDVLINPLYNYRYYKAPLVNGQVQANGWTDVTGDTTQVMIVNGKAHWFVNPTQWATLVRSDLTPLVYDLTLSPSNGLLKFSVTETVHQGAATVSGPMMVPPGQLDIWLNGCALIENIDYYVTWPQVVLVNKAFLNPGLTQAITVRATGFCNSDLTRPVADEASFLRWNALSHNDRFNIRDSKVVRIVANGRVFHRSQVAFSEDGANASISVVPNGSPYQVTQSIVPTRQYTDSDTYTLLTTQRQTDTAVENYLSLMIPDTTPPEVDIIPEKYPVFSPFASTIINDVVNGVILMLDYMGQYSDQDVRNRLQSYLYLLDYEPLLRDYDGLHVVVEPHNHTEILGVTFYQWQFISRALHIYLNDKLDLSNWLKVQM